MDSNIRAATHAGTWYSSSKEELFKELTSYLKKATKYETDKLLKGLIVPHAGYRFSGPTAAYSYINIDPKLYNRVVLLGPSHREYIAGCGLTPFSSYETPFGDIKIDTDSITKLSNLDHFYKLEGEVDEVEHSLEMQLPYLKMMFDEQDFVLLPIMVGSTDATLENYFGKILSEYYEDEKTLFVISSDFCHWGSRFNFTYHDKKNNYPYESIEGLDKLGMENIESMEPDNFTKYISSTKNTICGRKPISVFLNTIKESKYKDSSSIKFVKYAQSEQIKNMNGSSVSYAAGLNLI
jgi:AmmeMemoRadiSam system protein B